MLLFAVMLDIIKKSGSWFSYNGERIGQGKETVRKALESNPAFLAEVEAQVRAMNEQGKLAVEQDFEVDEDDDEFDIRLDADIDE